MLGRLSTLRSYLQKQGKIWQSPFLDAGQVFPGLTSVASVPDKNLCVNSDHNLKIRDSEVLNSGKLNSVQPQKAQTDVINSHLKTLDTKCPGPQAGNFYCTPGVNSPETAQNGGFNNFRNDTMCCYTPVIDQGIIDAQSKLIADIWPQPTDVAWAEAHNFVLCILKLNNITCQTS